MGYKKVYRNAVIETVNSLNLHQRYQAFLDSLNTPDYEIISVNYQAVVHRLESDRWDSGVSYSIVVTYSSVVWVDEEKKEEGENEIGKSAANYMFREVKSE